MIAQATYGTGKPAVAILPLALILVLHLLLLLWATSARVRADQGAEQRHFILTWLPAMKPRATPAPAPARPPAAPARVVRPPAAPAVRAPELAPSTDAQATSVQEEMQPANAPEAVDVNQMLDRARRQAGSIDRELRGGKAVPLAPDPNLPIIRFRAALESAYIDRSRTMVTESYAQPDGVIIYRFRYGGKVWCRQSGGGAPGIERSEGAKLAGAGSAGGGGAAGTVKCPSDATGWTRLQAVRYGPADGLFFRAADSANRQRHGTA